jgi:hypothetical protein
MKRLLLSTLALILLACRAATDTPPPQSTTTIPAPAAEVTPQTIQANNPTPAPPVQTSHPDPTPETSQTGDPTPAPPVQTSHPDPTPETSQTGDPTPASPVQTSPSASTPQDSQANNPTPTPPVQTSPSASTPETSQAGNPAPTPPDQPPATRFTPQVTQVGDPAVNYASIEFTADNRYMVWFEMTDTRGNGIVWHCGVDPATGDLIPPDGKGFRAFESTVFGRANPGLDADGPYYVGMDRAGTMILVRPTGPTVGAIRALPTPSDLTRRAIYPTILPDQPGGFVFWIKNEAVPGGGTNRANAWFELHYISLDDPAQVHIIERQERPRRGFAPMDSAFARWMKNKPALTYGFADANGVVQVRMLDLTQPNPVPQAVTNDPGNKVDPYSWFYNGREILIPGINAEARTHVYVRNTGEAEFRLAETIIPPASALARPALAQSNEPIVFNGRTYTVYQVNEAGASFWDMTFGKAGEIWLATLFETPQQQWLLTDSLTAKAEPEPLVGTSRVWVFYNVVEGDNPLTAVWHLYRAETPIR